MREHATRVTAAKSTLVSRAFAVVFFVIGVLNLFLVHPVPAVFYLLVTAVFVPPTNTLLKKKLNVSIPTVAKILIGLAILYPTLAVGDLAEILGL